MNGKVKIYNYWFDDTKSYKKEWSDDYINEYVKKFTVENIKNENYSGPYGSESIKLLEKNNNYQYFLSSLYFHLIIVLILFHNPHENRNYE